MEVRDKLRGRVSVSNVFDGFVPCARDAVESEKEVEDAEDEEASADDEEEEAVESARGRRTARGAPQKRKLPARANTRRNAQKRVKG